MVFCSIDVGVGGKVPFVVICHRAVLKHECREGTKGTNQGSVRGIRPFVLFVIRNLCVWQRMSGSEWW
jgi:hypothetical protein